MEPERAPKVWFGATRLGPWLRAKGPFVVRARGARTAALIALVVASGLSCGDDEPRSRTFRDVGEGFCLSADASGHATISFVVGWPPHCLSGCDVNTASCRAVLTGNRIDLLTRLEVRDRPGVELCTTECQITTGTCELDVPSPGDYDFGSGSGFDTATLPTEGRVPLFGGHSCAPSD